jgi:hypothetical protein
MAPDVELNSSSYRLDPRFQGSLVDVLAYPIKGPCCCFLIHSPECPLASGRVSQRRPKVTFWTQLRVGANMSARARPIGRSLPRRALSRFYLDGL